MTVLLTICGSLRSVSLNAALLRSLPDLGPAGVEFRSAPTFSGFPLYNTEAHQASGVPEAVAHFVDAIDRADGVVIASPEYNWSIPGGLKNALDWVSRIPDHPFKNKPVLLQSASAGAVGGARMQQHLRMVLHSLGALTFGAPELFVGQAQGKFDPGTLTLNDEAVKSRLRAQLGAFVDYAQRMAGFAVQ